jgi:hypothetical protein
MNPNHPTPARIKISFSQAINLLVPYVKKRIGQQLKSVALIILYLLVFQTVVLRLSLAHASTIALGLGMVVVGLTFFIEGLFLGMMPLGETLGVKLPRKAGVPFILVFAFILGVGATLAEPSIGVLRAAGNSIKPWEAPLLFLMLNKYSSWLVIAVGVGVGIAVMCGMLRFLYNWSLKPLILFPVLFLLGLSLWAAFDPNMRAITGIAWDCGGITTGPVTVPLVLALGIGICRVAGSGSSGIAGLGVVTLASLYPIITVMLLGLPLLPSVPQPMSETAFAAHENRGTCAALFESEERMIGYMLKNGTPAGRAALFGNDTTKLSVYLRSLVNDGDLRAHVLGNGWDVAQVEKLSREIGALQAANGTAETLIARMQGRAKAETEENGWLVTAVLSNIKLAVRAIVPLCLFLFLVLYLLRERPGRTDEIVMGILFALFGLGLFNVGMELGLAKIGRQVGNYLPSTFKAVEVTGKTTVITNFDTAFVAMAIGPDGARTGFFNARFGNRYVQVPYSPDRYDPRSREYVYTPQKGPLTGRESDFWGYFVLFLFALVMGYGVTLAEPALTTLGIKVEELTVGIFRRGLLVQSAALGVAIGMAFGLVKILWDIPVIYLLIPPYLIALVLTLFEREEFANIAWDSAGVTTGPVTVPLVLAMGLGIGSQLRVVEGFGILALASVWPIVSVLSVGMIKTWQRKAAVKMMSARQGEEDRP